MAKKQVIRLTESDLHKIIKESVNRILTESVFGDEYRDNTIPQDLQTVYYYARSWYKTALDELQNKDYLSSQTIAHLQNEVNNLGTVMMKRGKSNCPENVIKVRNGMMELLKQYGNRQ